MKLFRKKSNDAGASGDYGREAALQRAKEIENEEIPTAEHELEGFNEFMKESEHAKKILESKKKK